MAILDNVKAFWALGDAYNAPLLVDASARGNDLTPNLRLNANTGQFRAGRNSCTACGFTQQALAALKGWGKWDRLLTAGEKTALLGKEYWPFATTTSLQDAKAYFKYDEAGSATTFADATGRLNDLTVTGTTVRVNGPLGAGDNATRLDDGVYGTKASPGADLRSGQFACTIAGWANITTKGTGPQGQQVYWGQLENTSGVSGFNVYHDGSAADRFAFDCNAGDGSNLSQGTLVLANDFGAPALATWYFLLAEFDYVGNLIGMSVNGTRTTLTTILQPIPVAGHLANGSQFQLNPTASFATRTNGWDTGTLPVDGNCHASHAANADLLMGNNAKTVWGWMKTTAPTVNQVPAGFYNGTATNDWFFNQASNEIYFFLGTAGTKFVKAPLSDTNWHLIVGWFDKDNAKLKIRVDNGATVEASGPVSFSTVTYPFRLGADATAAGGHQFRGILEAWGIADGVPDQADLDALWNSGAGWTWPEEPSAVFTAVADYVVRIPADDYVVQIPADDGTVLM